MVTLGGGIGNTVADQNYAIDPNGQQRQVELYDPATKTWRLGPAEIEDRGYHSTALLLPNGRVWSAGDEKHPLEPGGGWALTDTAEIYSPPYLFKGPRPKIVSAPSELRWGDEFGVQVDTQRPRQVGRPGRARAPPRTAPTTTQRVVKLAVQANLRGRHRARRAAQRSRRAARLLHALRSQPGRALGRLVGATDPVTATVCTGRRAT